MEAEETDDICLLLVNSKMMQLLIIDCNLPESFYEQFVSNKRAKIQNSSYK